MGKKNENKKDDFIMDKGAELNTEELNDVSGGLLYRGLVENIVSEDGGTENIIVAGADESYDDELRKVRELAALVGKQPNRITKKLNG